jgi:AMMECR1 domain-containing protein
MSNSPDAIVPPADRPLLIELVHDAVRAHHERTEPPVRPPGASPAVDVERAVFVTLYLDGRLRGCIGGMTPVRPLWSAVAAAAVSAGFHDPRFDPLTGPEIAAISADISVLGPG